MTTCADAELQNVVRWYNYWLEDVSAEEQEEEKQLLERYKFKKLHEDSDELTGPKNP
jgi:hypothetical protein